MHVTATNNSKLSYIVFILHTGIKSYFSSIVLSLDTSSHSNKDAHK